MNTWILDRIASGQPYGVAFEEEGGTPGGEPGGEEAPAWAWAENVSGEGDAPDWFKSEKYATVADQAMAYPELEKKFGSFTGAPETYDVVVSDELKEKGVEFDTDDPMLAAAMEFGKEVGMNQDGMNRMLNLYATKLVAEGVAADEARAEEMKQLGQNAEGRLDALVKWGRANLPEDMATAMSNMMTTAAEVKAIEQLISMTGASALDPSGDAVAGAITEAELKEMQFATDEHGNRKIQTDKEFRAEYQKKMKAFHGEQDHKVIIGG